MKARINLYNQLIIFTLLAIIYIWNIGRVEAQNYKIKGKHVLSAPNDESIVIGNTKTKKIGIGMEPSASYIMQINGTNAGLVTGGAWYNVSDENIKNPDDEFDWDPNDILNKVINLDIKRWYYTAAPNIKYIGPYSAKEFNDTFGVGMKEVDAISTIDPSGVALLAIKALKKKYDSLLNVFTEFKEKIEQNNYQPLMPIDELKYKGEKLSDNENKVVLTDFDTKIPSLSQNRPNPFDSNTTINYFLPENINQAAILVFDMQGKQLKRIDLDQKGNGKVEIYGRELIAGMYLYALIADGKEIDTKRMILTE